MKLPTFLVIGVEKSGTTSLYHYLQQHLQVYMSPIKETNFLEKDWSEIDPDTIKRSEDKRIDTFKKYCALFADADAYEAVGEISPNYLFHHQTSAQRILNYVPEAQLIAILRHPVERAFSDYLMHRRDSINVGKVAPLLEQVKHQSNSSFTLRKGFYFEPIRHFINTFGRDRLKIYLYDQLCADPVALVQDMYRYIGVDETFTPDVSYRAQVAQVPKIQSINNVLKTNNPVRAIAASVLKPVLSSELRQKIRTALININSSSKDTVQLSLEERTQLLDLYSDDVKKLQDLIQQDLSAWLK